MDKTKIASIALEVADEMHAYCTMDDALGNQREFYEFSLPEMPEFATKFLARVREEEGKVAVGYDALFWAIASATKSASSLDGIEVSVKAFKAAIGGEIFLHPQEEESAALQSDAAKYRRLEQMTERGCYQLMYWDTDRDSWFNVSLIEAVKETTK